MEVANRWFAAPMRVDRDQVLTYCQAIAASSMAYRSRSHIDASPKTLDLRGVFMQVLSHQRADVDAKYVLPVNSDSPFLGDPKAKLIF